jgi:hypothetical protein
MVEIFDNIRKIYCFSTAGAELAEHIEFFAESPVEATQQFAPHAPFSVKMFASCPPHFFY